MGDAECKVCHPAESNLHQNSNHAITLRVADKKSLGKLAPPSGPIRGTGYAIKEEGEGFALTHAKETTKSDALHLAIGSGKIGMTYVHLLNDGTLKELRMSYFPREGGWYITPGQEEMMDSDLSRIHDGKASRKCLSCHTTTIPDHALMPERRFFGIGCENCHGPGSAHIEAIQSGKADLAIEGFKNKGATYINEACGKCHRSPDEIGTSGLEITMTQRFQPYGLMQSPCFKKSGDVLSCLTCHDPHSNASRDPKSYEPACLKCHGGVAPKPGDTTAVHSKTCPVNPKTKCIGCHMPMRRVFPKSSVGISMADHLIWAYRKKR